jgi:hypothetical protein
MQHIKIDMEVSKRHVSITVFKGFNPGFFSKHYGFYNFSVPSLTLLLGFKAKNSEGTGMQRRFVKRERPFQLQIF